MALHAANVALHLIAFSINSKLFSKSLGPCYGLFLNSIMATFLGFWLYKGPNCLPKSLGVSSLMVVESSQTLRKQKPRHHYSLHGCKLATTRPCILILKCSSDPPAVTPRVHANTSTRTFALIRISLALRCKLHEKRALV